MEEKPQPGAPPETIKPKPVNEDKPSFSYEELLFEDFFIVENRKYVRFFVQQQNPYFVDMYYSEFVDYQLFYFEERNKLIEADTECLCNIVSPHYEEMDKMKVEMNVMDTETKEFKENGEVEMAVYFIYNLLENTKVGNICNNKKD